MPFKIAAQSKNLLAAAKLAEKALPTKSLVPIQDCFMLNINDESITFTATDQTLQIKKRCEAVIYEPGTICIEGSRFLRLIEKLPNAVLDLYVSSNKLIVQRDRSKYEFPLYNVEEFPQVEPVSLPHFQIALSSLQTAIRHIDIIPQKEEEKGHLSNAITIAYDQHKMIVTGCDGKRFGSMRIAQREDLPPITPERISVLPRLSDIILSLSSKSNIISLRSDDSHISVIVDDTEIIARRLTGKPWELDQFFLGKHEHQITVDRVALLSAAQRALLFLETFKTSIPTIVLQFEGNGLYVFGSSVKGDSADFIECNYQGENLRVKLNGQAIIDFLNVVSTDQVQLKFPEKAKWNHGVEFNPVTKTPSEIYDFRYCALPFNDAPQQQPEQKKEEPPKPAVSDDEFLSDIDTESSEPVTDHQETETKTKATKKRASRKAAK